MSYSFVLLYHVILSFCFRPHVKPGYVSPSVTIDNIAVDTIQGTNGGFQGHVRITPDKPGIRHVCLQTTNKAGYVSVLLPTRHFAHINHVMILTYYTLDCFIKLSTMIVILDVHILNFPAWLY